MLVTNPTSKIQIQAGFENNNFMEVVTMANILKHIKIDMDATLASKHVRQDLLITACARD